MSIVAFHSFSFPVRLSLSHFQNAFQIQLEASVGESGYGDIAVDSFRLENGPCPGK